MAKKNALTVCITCRRAGTDPQAPRDGARLSDALAARGVPHDQQECFSACERSCVVVFRGAGRWTYVQGGLDPDLHPDDVAEMARAYAATPDGIVPWRSRPEVIRKNTIARIPPIEV
jgi:predicted metal-binding protein